MVHPNISKSGSSARGNFEMESRISSHCAVFDILSFQVFILILCIC